MALYARLDLIEDVELSALEEKILHMRDIIDVENSALTSTALLLYFKPNVSERDALKGIFYIQEFIDLPMPPPPVQEGLNVRGLIAPDAFAQLRPLLRIRKRNLQ